jgi:hypothetical protein
MNNIGLMSLLGAGALSERDLANMGMAETMRGNVPAVGLSQGNPYSTPYVGMQYSMPPMSRLGALMGSPYGYGMGSVGMLNQLLQKQFDDKMRLNEDAIIDYVLRQRTQSRPETLMDRLGVLPFM